MGVLIGYVRRCGRRGVRGRDRVCYSVTLLQVVLEDVDQRVKGRGYLRERQQYEWGYCRDMIPGGTTSKSSMKYIPPGMT